MRKTSNIRLFLKDVSGDTIVEVLISIVIVALVLGAAFTALNKGQNSTRASQERGEALKYAESQVEYLRQLAKSNQAAFQSIDGTERCITESSGTLSVVGVSDAACTKGAIPGGYRVALTENPAHRYNVLVTWEGAGGIGQQRLEMRYRLEQ